MSQAQVATILVIRRLLPQLKSDVALFHRAPDGTEIQTALLQSPKAADLEEAVQASFDGGICNAIMNLENFLWLDSAGLGVLVHALRRCRDAGGDIVLVKPNERVTRVLQVAQLDNVFTLADSEDEALARLRA